MMTTAHAGTATAMKSAPRLVVVVSKQSQLHGLLETMLDAGQYDVVLVESTEHAYSHIRRLVPELIIVCLDIDDIDGFHVLSMLKLDHETRGIPVVTCTTSSDDEDETDEVRETSSGVFSEPPAMGMN
jgi:two-component system, OmpR family, KDP operon response regulator KdpE